MPATIMTESKPILTPVADTPRVHSSERQAGFTLMVWRFDQAGIVGDGQVTLSLAPTRFVNYCNDIWNDIGSKGSDDIQESV